MTEEVKKKSIWQQILSWVLVIAVAIGIAMLVRTFVFAPVKVDGMSMYPTYEDGNRVFIEKLTGPDRFDKIVFDAPVSTGDEGKYFIKRVIGVPGDKIEFKEGILYLNGKKQSESYLADGMKTYREPGDGNGNFTLKDITGSATVPKGKLFVLGDNREGSMDSRIFGFINSSAVDGVVVNFGKK
ncbi:signal peptidase I [Listeria floridensis FSL S10-1187]|uniref:Signal peptidase I n=1 Tax=Listeria floridensis FSL S10-1187 TaxID=1265817 RepID=A0ABN0RCJ9_9LIST|nr:type I signal peptidase SipY [Listeria floridensis]EUJ27377.1 signal peptidase I [Listeria floridensis FSL S10-1187]